MSWQRDCRTCLEIEFLNADEELETSFPAKLFCSMVKFVFKGIYKHNKMQIQIQIMHFSQDKAIPQIHVLKYIPLKKQLQFLPWILSPRHTLFEHS